MTPTFFINGRRYAGAWDESSVADATLLALVLSNSALGPSSTSSKEN